MVLRPLYRLFSCPKEVFLLKQESAWAYERVQYIKYPIYHAVASFWKKSASGEQHWLLTKDVCSYSVPRDQDFGAFCRVLPKLLIRYETSLTSTGASRKCQNSFVKYVHVMNSPLLFPARIAMKREKKVKWANLH